MPGHDLSTPMEVDEGYVDVIAFKTIFEMTDPVMSPHTGHIYDRVDIMQWITQKGTDPIDRDKQLTAQMLVPGLFVKQIADASARKSASDDARFTLMEDRHTQEMRAMSLTHKQDMQAMEARHNTAIAGMEDRHTKKIDSMMALMQGVLDKNTALTKENEGLVKQVSSLSKENEQLRRGHTNPVWNKYGSDIDKKLKKGSAPERTEALRTYASKVKTAVTDSELQAAVNAADSFRDPKLSAPRRFGWFVKRSETSRLATEFQDKVCSEKGWECTTR